jgi:hypothetical protein
MCLFRIEHFLSTSDHIAHCFLPVQLGCWNLEALTQLCPGQIEFIEFPRFETGEQVVGLSKGEGVDALHGYILWRLWRSQVGGRTEVTILRSSALVVISLLLNLKRMMVGSQARSSWMVISALSLNSFLSLAQTSSLSPQRRLPSGSSTSTVRKRLMFMLASYE